MISTAGLVTTMPPLLVGVIHFIETAFIIKKVLCIDKNNSRRGLIAGRYETMTVGKGRFASQASTDSDIFSQYGEYNTMCGLDHRTAQLDCFVINHETTSIINILTQNNVRAMDHNNDILCFIYQFSGQVYCTKLDNLSLSELTIDDDINYNIISISKDVSSNLVCLGGDSKVSCYYWDEDFSLAPVFNDSNVLNQSYSGLNLPSDPCVINDSYEMKCF